MKRPNPYRPCLRLWWQVVVLVFWAASLPSAQSQNLVPNPGFEETDSCTFGLGLGELRNWQSAFGTPDHLQNCQPYGTANGLPMNMFTYQQPYEGNSCAGTFTYDGSSGNAWREWLIVPLVDSLVLGQTYYCSFQANAAFGGNGLNPANWLASDHLGMLFTTRHRHWEWGDPYPAALNHAHILHPQIVNDTIGWTLVSGSFVADSVYTYLMIGNFFSNALTDTLHYTTGVPEWGLYSYTLVDGVCVSPNPDGCNLNNGVEQIGVVTPFVYPNPATNGLVICDAAGSDGVVLDMLGNLIWSGRIWHNRFALDVGSWARGEYLLKVGGVQGVQAVKFVLAE